MGEGFDAGADGGQAVLAGGGEVAQEAEFGEEDGLGGEHFGGRGVVVEFDEQADEAFDQRGVGVVAQAEASACVFAEEPDGGDAAGDAVGRGFFGFGERGAAAGVGDHGGEALLAVFDQGEVFDEAGLFFGNGHGATLRAAGAGRQSSTSRQRVSRWSATISTRLG